MWHLLKDMRKKDKGLAFLAVLLIAGQVFLDLKLPDYTKEITVLISSESNTISDYLLSGGKMLACALGSALLAVIVGYLAAKIAADFEDRDYRDMHRDISPLRQAEDATLVDSSDMTIDQVVERILELCR